VDQETQKTTNQASAEQPPSVHSNANTGIITRIRPAKGWARLNLDELWMYRGLLYQMATRDFRVQYKKSVLGKFWALLKPLATMIIFYTIFGLILKLKTGTVPYPIFLLAGILLWQLIGGTAALTSSGLISNTALVNKVYFPRLIIPLSQTISGLVDFAFGLIVLFGFMFFSDIYPTWLALTSPLFVLLALLTGLTFGLWFAPINLKFRDVGQVVPVALQLLMYLTPVFYSPDLVPAKYQAVYYLNPAAGILQGFRWTLMGDTPPPLSSLYGIVVMVCFFVLGLYFFKKHEAEFADNL
jgi:lipopolysaccharide transport system permease protein